MAQQVKIEMNSEGFEELLRSEEVQDLLAERAERIASAAGPGHDWDVYQGGDRARAVIWTDSQEAKLSEAEDRTLTIAVDAARD